MMQEFEHDEPHRPAPPLKEQLITGAKVFGIVAAVMLAVWFIDAAVNG